MSLFPKVLLLTGTCGSGKSTVASLLARRGWDHISEDEIWPRLFGRNRGSFGSAEHRAKRRRVHDLVFQRLSASVVAGREVVIDATVHEAPPEAFEEYLRFFEEHRIDWWLRVLHPSVEVSIARDAGRGRGSLGAERVAALHAKFTGLVFARDWFLDTSAQTPEDTLRVLLQGGAARPACETADLDGDPAG